MLGDIIVAVNGKKIKDYDNLRDELERHEVGESIALTLLRDSAEVEVRVTLEALE